MIYGNGMTCGIYEIVNTVNGKRYVGSSVDIDSRWQTHLRELRRGTHHAQHLQRSFNKHGEDAFVIRCIAECERDDLIPMEQAELDSGYDYNSSPTAGNTLGLKFSNEARERVRQNRLDRYAADPIGYAEMMSAISKGKPKSDEWKRMMSERMIGSTHSDVHVENMAKSRAEICETKVRIIRAMRLSGMDLNVIANKIEAGWSSVRRICAGERYRWAYNDEGPVPFDAYASRRKKKAPY